MSDKDDLISRKEALKICRRYWHPTFNPIMGEIEKLPSAQSEIIRCKDCDWWTKQEDSVQGRCELMQMHPAGGWYCGNARRRPNEQA